MNLKQSEIIKLNYENIREKVIEINNFALHYRYDWVGKLRKFID